MAASEVRKWAIANGWPQVAGNRGRLPKEALAAYNKAHEADAEVLIQETVKRVNKSFGKCRCGARATYEYSPPKGRTQSLCSSCKPR